MSAPVPRTPEGSAAPIPPGNRDRPAEASWTPAQLRHLFDAQRAARWSTSQTSAFGRGQLLDRLREAVKASRQDLAAALAQDLGKSRAEAEITEIHPLLDELRLARRHLRAWMTPQRVRGAIDLGGGRSEIVPEAKGVTLILSPWNYPLNLSLAPLVGALAAGNTAILKPSEKAPATARALSRLLAATFPPSLVTVVEGEADVAQALLALPFDHVFFTGSPAIGRKVMAAAAQTLASVTLELGGKSPTIVDATADLDLAATRIAWGKFLNSGQTCVAPDYVLVHESVADRFEALLPPAIRALYGEAVWQRVGPDYGRMIDEAAVVRLRGLTDASVQAGARVLCGGEFDEAKRFISPTVLGGAGVEMPIMQEEIFGPVLPVLRYRHLDEALELIRSYEKPLALYLFSSDPAAEAQVRRGTSSGSLVVNGTVIQFVHPHLPFGGVGHSGQGGYHGEQSFREFSHLRAVTREPAISPVLALYPPYGRVLPRFTSWALRKLRE